MKILKKLFSFKKWTVVEAIPIFSETPNSNEYKVGFVHFDDRKTPHSFIYVLQDQYGNVKAIKR